MRSIMTNYMTRAAMHNIVFNYFPVGNDIDPAKIREATEMKLTPEEIAVTTEMVLKQFPVEFFDSADLKYQIEFCKVLKDVLIASGIQFHSMIIVKYNWPLDFQFDALQENGLGSHLAAWNEVGLRVSSLKVDLDLQGNDHSWTYNITLNTQDELLNSLRWEGEFKDTLCYLQDKSKKITHRIILGHPLVNPNDVDEE